MTTFADLIPDAGHRVMLVGQTGSGKTTLARALLAYRAHVVVLDVKGMIRWPEYRVYTDFNKLRAADPREVPRMVYRPDPLTAEDPDALELFFTWVYRRRHCTCYVDELMGVTRGDVAPPHFNACFTRGRELGIEMWTATQRPKRVPMVTLSEAEHLYAFRLKLGQDRQRVWELTGMPEEQIAQLPKFDFLYSRQDAETQGPLRLNLKKKSALTP